VRRCSNASSLLRKDIVDMDLDKKLKIMENRNTLLEKENKKLKEELAQSGSLDKKYKELEKLKDNWEKEISDIRALKEQYTRLLDGMKN
jgi:chromosome segregation ATPase